MTSEQLAFMQRAFGAAFQWRYWWWGLFGFWVFGLLSVTQGEEPTGSLLGAIGLYLGVTAAGVGKELLCQVFPTAYEKAIAIGDIDYPKRVAGFSDWRNYAAVIIGICSLVGIAYIEFVLMDSFGWGLYPGWWGRLW